MCTEKALVTSYTVHIDVPASVRPETTLSRCTHALGREESDLCSDHFKALLGAARAYLSAISRVFSTSSVCNKSQCLVRLCLKASESEAGATHG